jgi:hypothetical protein
MGDFGFDCGDFVNGDLGFDAGAFANFSSSSTEASNDLNQIGGR